MTTAQIAAAKKIAQSDADLSRVDDSLLCGLALPSFTAITVGVNVVAKCLRDHLFWDGSGFDENTLNESGVYSALRRKVQIA
jgi:hypothetical protein